jgi:dTDP-4-dehydrorhamnose reductase
VRPDVIVNAAGYTAVDKAESEPDLAMQINAVAPGVMAETAKGVGALLVHYSTVFVFDGTKNEPYVESDTPRPLNMYGKSKLAGERAIIESAGRYIILRATWTYSDRRANFPLAILHLARKKRELKVVDDQVGTPTWAKAYARATAQLLQRTDECRDSTGVYHLSAAGETTRYQWAKVIIEVAQQRFRDSVSPKLLPTTTADYALPAVRPLYTVMDTSKVERVFGVRMSAWEEQFRTFLASLPAHLYSGAAIHHG